MCHNLRKWGDIGRFIIPSQRQRGLNFQLKGGEIRKFLFEKTYVPFRVRGGEVAPRHAATSRAPPNRPSIRALTPATLGCSRALMIERKVLLLLRSNAERTAKCPREVTLSGLQAACVGTVIVNTYYMPYV